VVGETMISWYPPGGTWIIAAASRLSGFGAVGGARILWVAGYILNACLLGRVLAMLPDRPAWMKEPWAGAAFAACILWWIAGCDPTLMSSTDMLALPLNLALLLGCLRLTAGDNSWWRWLGCGALAGTIYLVKYSQFIVAASMLATTAVLVIGRERTLKRLVRPALAGVVMLSFVLALVLFQRHDRASVQLDQKSGLAQAGYIKGRYGDRFASVSTPSFCLLGVAGGLGWNSLGYGRWTQLPWYLAGRESLNRAWDRLGWNRICSWCLLFGVALTPVAWRALRTRLEPGNDGAAWLLPGSGILAVMLIAYLGYRTGYPYNMGLEGEGRFLLPLSVVAVAGLFMRGARRHPNALLFL
ncbi:MAG TPA: glycosyltransferase family 39 protein, partial [bacterium]|nr:glycosyltransferase family 39 protein [bacterium]